MAEQSRHWGGTTVGDAVLAPYDDDEDWSDIWRVLFGANRAYRAVVPNIDNELLVSNPAGATVRVATGWAVVDGKFYRNTANVDFSVSGVSVYWVVGLRKDWTARTVRLFIRGTYASSALALSSLVQSDGATWEVAIATVLTDGSGNVSAITDQRHFLKMSNIIAERRQGGDPDDWGVAGSTSYPPNLERVVYGVANITGTVGLSSGTFSVTFPFAYVEGFPLVLLTAHVDKIVVMALSTTLTGFDIYWHTVDGSNTAALSIGVSWLAIGKNSNIAS